MSIICNSFAPSANSNFAESPPDGAPAPVEKNAALLARIAARDPVAFERLYEDLASPMFCLVLRIVGSRADAEDVLQLGFLQVWRSAPYYRADRGSPMAWIATIMRRKAIDSLRLRLRHSQGINVAFQLRAEALEAPAGDASLVISERQAAVRRALFQLNLPERSAIQLAFFDGLTNLQIAQVLGASLGTIKSRIRRGMMKLRRSWVEAVPAASRAAGRLGRDRPCS